MNHCGVANFPRNAREVVKSKPSMRSIVAVLALIIALAPALAAFAGAALHEECGSAASSAMQDADMHAAHAMHDPAALPEFEDSCACGCDCGPAHGCLTASAAAPVTAGQTVAPAGEPAPAKACQAFSTRGETPLYRPPISR
ncbi:hypothetical protein BH24PSE2_BH24PSE2_07920 [soil metagenome]